MENEESQESSMAGRIKNTRTNYKNCCRFLDIQGFKTAGYGPLNKKMQMLQVIVPLVLEMIWTLSYILMLKEKSLDSHLGLCSSWECDVFKCCKYCTLWLSWWLILCIKLPWPTDALGGCFWEVLLDDINLTTLGQTSYVQWKSNWKVMNFSI